MILLRVCCRRAAGAFTTRLTPIPRCSRPWPIACSRQDAIHTSLPDSRHRDHGKRHGELPEDRLADGAMTFGDADEDEELDEDEGLPVRDFEERKVVLGNRRLDSLVHLVFKNSKTETDKLVLGKRVRVNEQIVTKRSRNLEAGDTIDQWIQGVEGNNELAEIKRAIVRKWSCDMRGYHLVLRIWNKLIVENWLYSRKGGERGPISSSDSAL